MSASIETVAVVGVGLIGGSFALALRQAGFAGRILGVSSAATLETAVTSHVIDAGASLEDAVAAADLVYLAAPVLATIDLFPRLKPLLRPHTLVTDAGSTKAQVVAAAQAAQMGAQFLGGHPMAGKESRGVTQAEASLFSGRPYVVTPQNPDDLANGLSAEFVDWLRRIGCRTMVMTPTEHDELVAWCSHLPQLLSIGLASTLADVLPKDRLQSLQLPVGPGLQSMTRLAESSFDLWADILETNKPAILEALERFESEITSLRAQLQDQSLVNTWTTASVTANRLRQRTT